MDEFGCDEPCGGGFGDAEVGFLILIGICAGDGV